MRNNQTEIQKQQNDTNTDFLKELLPWSASLPEDRKKLKSYKKTISLSEKLVWL